VNKELMKKNKILIGIIIVLVVLNITSLSFLWLGRGGQEHDNKPPKIERFLGRRLQLTDKQIQAFRGERKNHFSTSESLIASLTKARIALTLNSESTIKDSLLQVVVSKNEQLEALNLEHFQKLRSICNDQQKIKFDSLMVEMLIKGDHKRRGR
jgi:hypothetical protein